MLKKLEKPFNEKFRKAMKKGDGTKKGGEREGEKGR